MLNILFRPKSIAHVLSSVWRYVNAA